jgi:hypothetical protein
MAEHSVLSSSEPRAPAAAAQQAEHGLQAGVSMPGPARQERKKSVLLADDWGRLAVAIWGSLVGEAIQAVLGYLFAYRTTAAALRMRR